MQHASSAAIPDECETREKAIIGSESCVARTHFEIHCYIKDGGQRRALQSVYILKRKCLTNRNNTQEQPKNIKIPENSTDRQEIKITLTIM